MRILNKYNPDKLSREEYSDLWEDNCILGTVYALYIKDGWLSMKDVAKIIGWGRYSVKNAFTFLRRRSFIRYSIKELKLVKPRYGDGAKVLFTLSDGIKKLPFEEIKEMLIATHFRNRRVDGGPNKPESLLLEICDELYSTDFYYSGRTIIQNRVGTIYPDIRHKNYNIVIEHFGSRFHSKEEERRRVKLLESLGYKCLIIWDAKRKNKNKIKKEIKEFVDNAI